MLCVVVDSWGGFMYCPVELAQHFSSSDAHINACIVIQHPAGTQ